MMSTTKTETLTALALAVAGAAHCRHCAGIGRELNHSRLGHKLRALRRRAGRQQRDIARQMHVSQAQLSNLEHGYACWDVESILSYLRACGPDVEA